jgi:hypothetical protein
MAIPEIPPGGIAVPLLDGEVKISELPGQNAGVLQFECAEAGQTVRVAIKNDDAVKLVAAAAPLLNQTMPMPGFQGNVRALPVSTWSVLPGGDDTVLFCFGLQLGGALCFPLAKSAAGAVLETLEGMFGKGPAGLPDGASRN